MIDFVKEFKEYLPGWCEKKMQPMPKENTDRWNMAWYDFMNDVLLPKWDDIAQSYKHMQFKIHNPQTEDNSVSITSNTQETQEIVQECKLSEWEKVQQLLKSNKTL